MNNYLIKSLIQKVKDIIDELESKPITNIYDIDIEKQQELLRYKNILNNLRFIDYYDIDVFTPKTEIITKDNDDVFRLAFEYYGDYELGENLLLENDFNDLLPDKGTRILIKYE